MVISFIYELGRTNKQLLWLAKCLWLHIVHNLLFYIITNIQQRIKQTRKISWNSFHQELLQSKLRFLDSCTWGQSCKTPQNVICMNCVCNAEMKRNTIHSNSTLQIYCNQTSKGCPTVIKLTCSATAVSRCVIRSGIPFWHLDCSVLGPGIAVGGSDLALSIHASVLLLSCTDSWI